MEGTHGELCARLADRLRRNDADCLAKLNQTARSQVAAVAKNADAALGFAGEHRANLDPLDTRCLNRGGPVFRDLLVDVDNRIALEVLDTFERNPTDDAVTQRLNDFA